MWVATFDFEALEFTSEGTVYHFPRDNHCDVSGSLDRPEPDRACAGLLGHTLDKLFVGALHAHRGCGHSEKAQH